MYITFSALNAVFYPRETEKVLKLRGSAPDPAGGAHSTPPDPLAGFKPILCLVVFFIGRNYMRISLSSHF